MAQQQEAYPLQFSVDYPNRPLNRLSSAFRIFAIIPIAIVSTLVSSGSLNLGDSLGKTVQDVSAGITGVGGWVFFAVILMILFRQKYPRWWYDWNLALLKFANRVGSYFLLLRDEYPSTDEEQAVHLDIQYPDVKRDLNRWLPLVKWLLAFPHYIVLVVLGIAALVVSIVAWFSILFTGRYPRDPFDFVVGVVRCPMEHPRVGIRFPARHRQVPAVPAGSIGQAYVQGAGCIVGPFVTPGIALDKSLIVTIISPSALRVGGLSTGL